MSNVCVCVQQHFEHSNNNKLNYRLRGTTHCVLLCSNTTKNAVQVVLLLFIRSSTQQAAFQFQVCFQLKTYYMHGSHCFVMQKPNPLSLSSDRFALEVL